MSLRRRKMMAAVCLGCTAALTLTACGGSTNGSAAASSAAMEAVSGGEGVSEGEAVISASGTEGGTEDAALGDFEEQIMNVEILDGEYSVDDCIELAEYKNLDLIKTVYAVNEEDVNSYMMMDVEPVDAGRPAQEGDTVDLSYTATIDGETYDEGEDYEIVLGAEGIADGVDANIIGMSAGETKSFEVTFGDDYYDESVIGKTAVYEATVSAVMEYPEITDEWVSNYTEGDCTTVDEFRESVRADLEEEYELYSQMDLQNQIWQYLLVNSQFKALPKKYMDAALEEFDSNFEMEAAMMDTDAAQYKEDMGMSDEEFEENRQLQARFSAANRLITEALCAKEGIEDSGEAYDQALNQLAGYYGETPEGLLEYYTEEELKDEVLTRLVADKVISYANVTEEAGSLYDGEETIAVDEGGEIVLDEEDLEVED